MESTRLKRELRLQGTPLYEEALALLDALDRAQENAESYEQAMRTGASISERDMSEFVQQTAQELVQALVALPTINYTGVLDVLFAKFGYDEITNYLQAVKRRIDEQSQELGELDNYPF